jgi:hypothetical protein
MTLTQWSDRLEEVAIENKATEYEIAIALAFLSICADLQSNPEYGAPPK